MPSPSGTDPGTIGSYTGPVILHVWGGKNGLTIRETYNARGSILQRPPAKEEYDAEQ